MKVERKVLAFFFFFPNSSLSLSSFLLHVEAFKKREEWKDKEGGEALGLYTENMNRNGKIKASVPPIRQE